MPPKVNTSPTFTNPRQLAALTRPSQPAMCRVAGFLVREDEEAIYIADPQGTWVLPHESYEALNDWPGGKSAPEEFLSLGRPVSAVLKEGALIHEIRPWRIRKGGDPINNKLQREAIKKIFSLDAGNLPVTDRTQIGETQLARLEELLGRRLGWSTDMDVSSQSFFGHHLRSASWDCQSDGGGS